QGGFMIGIVDYGAGNLQSVKKACQFLGFPVKIVGQPVDMGGVGFLILPGVGSFGPAVANMQASGLYDVVGTWLDQDKPFLGICLGMQLLFESSQESAGIRGFGVISGAVEKFRCGKIPHMGWNRVSAIRPSRLLPDDQADSCFYFVHSYFVRPAISTLVSSTTDYWIRFAAVIERGNLFATQFHPEKSGRAGLELLKRWRRLW
ncbi:MAG: imidazole glycerol phosphate synthase subunit HisH, partial [Chitinivibrionales bacterium]|nr:imidazole glycerol phosphate synthase subunit HisH [Chitinivibrionales bacterium]